MGMPTTVPLKLIGQALRSLGIKPGRIVSVTIDFRADVLTVVRRRQEDPTVTTTTEVVIKR